MTSFGCRCLYLWLCLLLTWQDLQVLTDLRMVVCIPFQYIMDLILDMNAQGVGGIGGTN
jgi:hypothetical protein